MYIAIGILMIMLMIIIYGAARVKEANDTGMGVRMTRNYMKHSITDEYDPDYDEYSLDDDESFDDMYDDIYDVNDDHYNM